MGFLHKFCKLSALAMLIIAVPMLCLAQNEVNSDTNNEVLHNNTNNGVVNKDVRIVPQSDNNEKLESKTSPAEEEVEYVKVDPKISNNPEEYNCCMKFKPSARKAQAQKIVEKYKIIAKTQDDIISAIVDDKLSHLDLVVLDHYLEHKESIDKLFSNPTYSAAEINEHLVKMEKMKESYDEDSETLRKLVTAYNEELLNKVEVKRVKEIEKSNTATKQKISTVE